MDIKNKVVVITGAGNGVGRELTLALLRQGAKVAAVDIDEKGLEETFKLSGDHRDLTIHRTDITVKSDVESLLVDVCEKHYHVDILINNAGIIQPFKPVSDMNIELIRRVMEVNYFGMVNMTKVFLPEMENRPKAHIANISSMGGFMPVPGQGAYGASKAAVKLFTESLYAEMAGSHISISVVYPGGIATDIMKNSDIETKENDVNAKGVNLLLTPQKAARLVIKCIESESFRAVIGKDAKLMHFLYKFNTKAAIRLMKKILTMA